MVLLGLSNAFDSIDHKILLHNLANVGASPTVVKWFESYLSGRSQVVRIGSTLSSLLPVTNGVSQGAFFPPFVYIYIYICIDDLPSITPTCQLESYVDDSKLLFSFLIRDANIALGKIRQNLLEVARWCCEHKLLINPFKTTICLSQVGLG